MQRHGGKDNNWKGDHEMEDSGDRGSGNDCENGDWRLAREEHSDELSLSHRWNIMTESDSGGSACFSKFHQRNRGL